jgi:hypothetical protein
MKKLIKTTQKKSVLCNKKNSILHQKVKKMKLFIFKRHVNKIQI